MRRFRGGNAGKQKRQMNDATFLDVVGGGASTADVAEGSSGTAVQEAPLLDDSDVGYSPRAVAHEQGLTPINGFVFSRFVLGTLTCSACHCELIYYQDRQILHQGFAFRCRVCQSMQTIVLDEE